MSLQNYKSMMYAGGLLILFSVAAFFVEYGVEGLIMFCAGFLALLAGAVGYLWNGD